MRKLLAVERPSLIEENRQLHRAMVQGVPVEYRAADGSIRGDAVRLVDPEDQHNDWLAIAQFTVIENGHNRRPDVVVFLNGLPIGVVEVKRPGAKNATLGATQTTQRSLSHILAANTFGQLANELDDHRVLIHVGEYQRCQHLRLADLLA